MDGLDFPELSRFEAFLYVILLQGRQIIPARTFFLCSFILDGCDQIVWPDDRDCPAPGKDRDAEPHL